jgi:hypothetical protein
LHLLFRSICVVCSIDQAAPFARLIRIGCSTDPPRLLCIIRPAQLICASWSANLPTAVVVLQADACSFDLLAFSIWLACKPRAMAFSSSEPFPDVANLLYVRSSVGTKH